MITSDHSAFWEFSLRFYATSEVQQACLKLQDTYGADVNIMLFMLFQASLGHRLSETTIRELDAKIAGWRNEIVQPLRELRRRLKAHPFSLTPDAQETFRNQIKKVELQSEKLEQFYLETIEIGTDVAPPDQAALENTKAYARHLNVDVDVETLGVLHDRFSTLQAEG